ncbi:MAG: GxxExxY protein [Alphaproteobacteria bacterium]
MDSLHPNDPANGIAEKILNIAFSLHRQYGPGLLESAYEHLLCYELKKAGLKAERQKTLPLIHDNQKIDAGYRLDLIVDDLVIVELKCVQKILPVHEAQLLTYLNLSKIRLGLILNFHSKLLKDGIKRLVL